MAATNPCGTDVRRSRGRPPVTDDAGRRALILATARRVFLGMGYARTTTHHIALECQISKATLYRLYESKLALFADLIAQHQRTVVALPRPVDDLPLAQSIRAIFRFDDDEEFLEDRFAFARMAFEAAAADPEVGRILHENGVGRSRRFLADWLERECHRGRMTMADCQVGARILLAMMFGMIDGSPTWLISRPERALRELRIRQCIETFLHGVLPRGETVASGTTAPCPEVPSPRPGP